MLKAKRLTHAHSRPPDTWKRCYVRPQVQFAAYKQFCDDTTTEKTRAIKEAEEKIEVLKADIEKNAANIDKLGKEVADLEEDSPAQGRGGGDAGGPGSQCSQGAGQAGGRVTVRRARTSPDGTAT